MRKTNEKGEATVLIIGVLVVALIGALGWIFWQNVIADKGQPVSPVGTVVDKGDDTVQEDTPKYIDLRKNKEDATGPILTTVAEVDALEGVGDKLRAYMQKNVGIEQNFEGGTVKKTYQIDRLYGDYAVGNPTTMYYAVLGPKDGTGEIDILAGTQDEGFKCEDLTAAKVPAQLVDGKCLDSNSSLVDYTN